MKNLETHFPLTTGPAPASAPGPVQFSGEFSCIQAGYPSASGMNRGCRARVSVETAHSKENKPLPKFNRMTHRPHGVKVEAEVVDRIQNLRQHLARRIEMPQVGPRVARAHLAATAVVQRPCVRRVAGLLDRNLSF